jgi:hypothetical protein
MVGTTSTSTYHPGKLKPVRWLEIWGRVVVQDGVALEDDLLDLLQPVLNLVA